ncbi:4Fe-4S binding protein [Intestinibacter sp.]|uniref:4Fe-4S binding protein n=1 Tax=Intestinibacter sp. TaxID=1965304 RepID=UPI003F187BE6
MKKYSITQITRHIIQLLSFILFPGLFILTWNAISSIYRAILEGTFTLSSMMSPILILIAVIPITIFLGRFFCGYICAFGSMQEFLNYLGTKLKIKNIKINPNLDKKLKYIKYILIIIFVMLWTFNITIDAKLSPWNVFGVYSSYKGWSDFSMLLTFGGLLLLLIIISSLFVERVFCRYFCPLGAIFSLISKPRIYKIKKDSTECVNCDLCTKKCPMGIDVDEETSAHGKVISSECVDCFKCIDTCKPKALYINPKQTVSGIVVAAIILGIYCAGTMTPNTSNSGEQLLQNSLTQGKYTDGTYTGSGEGYRGTVTVEVKVSDRNISSITVQSYQDDEPFFDKAQNTIINEIISNQSTDVDVVSGATYSSNGIIEAVSDALGVSFTNPNDQMENERGHGGGHRHRME